MSKRKIKGINIEINFTYVNLIMDIAQKVQRSTRRGHTYMPVQVVLSTKLIDYLRVCVAEVSSVVSSRN